MSEFSDASVLEDLERLRTYFWGQDRVKVASVAGKTYSTVDLTLFDLTLNARPDNVLLVRDEYNLAYEAILRDTLRQPTGWWRSATLVTGKTLFLLYVLVRRLQAQERVALQINSSEFAVFDKSGVSLHSSEIGRVPRGTWTLSDASGESRGLCSAFQIPSAHVIHTSLPASHRWRGWVKRLSAKVYIMDVWSLEEIQTLLTIRHLDVQHGVALFRKYGPSPRIIIDILLAPTKEEIYIRDVTAGAVKLASQFSTAFLDLQLLDFSSDISSMIFTLKPDISKSPWPILYIPTKFLTSTFGVAMSRQTAAQQHFFFRLFDSHPTLRSTVEWLFENYAYVCFSDPTRNPIEAYLRDRRNPHLTAGPVEIPTPAKIITGSALRDTQPPHNFYWRPRGPTFDGVDAVIRAGDIVWALQYTINASSLRPATDGLTEVYKIMNHITGVECRLVMVGSNRREAKVARDRQRLTGQWEKTPVYASVLPLGEFTDDNAQRLQDALDEDTYPVDQGADSDVPMD